MRPRCGTAIISDYWEGLGTFFRFGEEILISSTAEHTLRYLTDVSDREIIAIGERARRKVLTEHTASHRVEQLECYIKEAKGKKRYSQPIRLTRSERDS